MRPIWIDAVSASIFAMAAIAPSASWLATVTVPSSSTSMLAPDDSWMARIVLPPGPMSRPIFSGSIRVRSRRGAHGEISSRGRRIADSMFLRISSLASRDCRSVASMMAGEMPSIFRSSWMPVMPWWEPAILKSMSP